MGSRGDDVRTFDAREANSLLPEVRRLVARVVETSTRLPDLDDAVKVARYRATRPGAGGGDRARLEQSEAELQDAQTAFAAALIALEEIGVHLKDAREGLVDFLAYRDGELIELCWKLGEERVAHWHRIGEGFRGRKPL